MNQTDPNIGYTISLNLDDDDPLLVQNMNEDDDAAVTFLSSYQYVHFLHILLLYPDYTYHSEYPKQITSVIVYISIIINMCKICTC